MLTFVAYMLAGVSAYFGWCLRGFCDRRMEERREGELAARRLKHQLWVTSLEEQVQKGRRS